jgi:hypothetical protein
MMKLKIGKIKVNSHVTKNDLPEYSREEEEQMNAHVMHPQRYAEETLVSEWFETYEIAAASMKWTEREKLDNLKFYIGETLRNWLDHATAEGQECVGDYEGIKRAMIAKFDKNNIDDRMRSLEACKMNSGDRWEKYIYKKAARIRSAFAGTRFQPEEITALIISGLTPELKDALRGKRCGSIDELHNILSDYSHNHNAYMNVLNAYAGDKTEKSKKKGIWCECENTTGQDTEEPWCERCDGLKREMLRKETEKKQSQRNNRGRWQKGNSGENRNDWRPDNQRNWRSGGGYNNDNGNQGYRNQKFQNGNNQGYQNQRFQNGNNQGYQNQRFQNGNNQGTFNGNPRAKVNAHVQQEERNMDYCSKCKH